MPMPNPTYAELSVSLHAAGGVTQTEAIARMSSASLRRLSLRSLVSILGSLRREASICTTEGQYELVRVQIDRVRPLVLKKEGIS